MLAKTKYPHLNRAQRRNPKKFVQQLSLGKGWNSGGSWLLLGLMHRGGHNAKPAVLTRDDPNFGAVL